MPHATLSGSSRHRDTFAQSFLNTKMFSETRLSMEKFPDHTESIDTQFESQTTPNEPVISNGQLNGTAPCADRWQPRQEGLPPQRSHGRLTGGRGHAHQKSLSDAFRTIRTRRASVGENAHEIAEALKAPVSPKLIVCTHSRIVKVDVLIFDRYFASFGTLPQR